MSNFITLMGRVTQNIETKFLNNGSKVTNINIASNTRKGGEDVVTFYRVAYFGEQLDKMLAYVKKGSALIVTGQLQPPRVYQAKDGTNKVSLEVKADSISFSPFGKGNSEEQGGGYQKPEEGRMQAQPSFDELPF